MPDNQISETWLSRIINLINKSPLIAVCLYLVYSMYKMQVRFDEKEQRWEQRELQREKENKEIWSYYLEDRRNDQRLKELELSHKYEQDSATKKN